MKTRILPILALVISATSAMAQNEDDAIRYSNVIPMGTAKFISMGGAMGAIGGDLSAISINPASVAVYRNNQISLTPMWNTEKSKTKYYGTTTNANSSDFKFSNVGIVSVFPTYEDAGFISFSAGIGYNRIANFDGGYVAKGYNDMSSMLDKEFNDFLDDKWIGNVFYQSDLIWYDTTTNQYTTDYIYDDDNTGVVMRGANQHKSVSTSGSLGEYNFSLGFNINNKFYIGGSMNVVRVDYRQLSKYTETPDIEAFAINDFIVTDEFTTIGSGINMKLGMIGWLTDYIRFGAAFQTPTILNLSDDYGTRVESNIWWIDNETGEPFKNNKKNSSYGDVDWNLTLPAKILGSVAFVLPQRGMIDIDCEVVNYATTSLDDSDEYIGNEYEDINNSIADIYHTTLNLRLGGELSFGPMVARGGFGFYGSPYKSGYENSSAHRMVYSLGVGYRTQHFSFDVGYSLSTRKSTQYLYSYTNSATSLKTNNSALAMTFGFRF